MAFPTEQPKFEKVLRTLNAARVAMDRATSDAEREKARLAYDQALREFRSLTGGKASAARPTQD